MNLKVPPDSRAADFILSRACRKLLDFEVADGNRRTDAVRRIWNCALDGAGISDPARGIETLRFMIAEAQPNQSFTGTLLVTTEKEKCLRTITRYVHTFSGWTPFLKAIECTITYKSRSNSCKNSQLVYSD